MELLAPKMMTGYAYNSYTALFPELWLGLQGYWTPTLGRTGNYFPDWTGQNALTGSGATANISQVAQGASANVTALAASGSCTVSVTVGTQAKLNIIGLSSPGTQATATLTITGGTQSQVTIGTVVSTVATYTATVSGGAITGLTPTNAGGGGYAANQYVTVTQSGSGNNAVIQINTVSSGAIATFTIISGGTGYTASAGACSVLGIGAITSITAVTTAGTGYVVGQSVAVTGGGGSGATATVLTVSGTGISTLALDNPGTGYTAGTGITLAQSGSVATAAFGGTAGTNYTATQLVPPYPYYGSGATFSITASSGVVQATPTITAAGTGYHIGQVINIVQNGGVGATLTVVSTIASTGAITSVSLTTGGTGYTTQSGVAVYPVMSANASALVSLTTVSGGAVSALTLNAGGTAGYTAGTFPIAPAGTALSASVNTAGTQYVLGQVLTITQGPTSGATALVTGCSTGATINFTATGGVVQASGLAINNAGSGYVVGQVLTILSGNSNSTVTVTSVNGAGAITGIGSLVGGSGYTNGSNTGKNLTWGIITSVQLIGGTSYIIGGNLGTLPQMGPATGVTFVAGGQGYYIGQVLTIYSGPSTGATVTVTAVTTGTGAATSISFTAAGNPPLASYISGGTALFQTAGSVQTIALNAVGTEYVAGQILTLAGGAGNFGSCTTSVGTIGSLGVIATLSPINPPSNPGSGYMGNVTGFVNIVAIGGVIVSCGLALGTVGSPGGGSGYIAGNSYTISGGGANATVTVDSINSLGQITALHLTSGGTGYSSTLTVALVAPGVQTYTLTTGILGGLSINNAGVGYTANQVVTLNQTGSTITASALVTSVSSTGQITGLTLQNGGSGYNTASVNIGTISTGLTVTIDYVIPNGNVQTGVNANANLTSVLWWTVGQGYKVGQVVNVLGANGVNGSAQITALTSSTAATVNITSVNAAGGITGVSVGSTAGTFYIANQVLNVTGGGGTGGMITVTSVSGGGITAISIKEAGTGYSTGSNLTLEGAGYINTGTTLSIIDPGTGYSGTLGSGNVAIQTGILTHLTLTAGGSGYFAGQVVPIFQSSTGYGASVTVNTVSSGAQATYTVSGGVVQATPTIANGGTGYVVGQVLTILAGNNNATLTVSTVSSGVITGWTLSAGGTGYSAGTSNVTTGIATSITLLQGGQGYSAGTGIATLTGNISATPSINNAGTGYVTNQILSVYPTSTSLNATFYVQASGGVVQWINVVNGGVGYSVGQILTLQAGDNTAQAVVSAVTSGVITAAYLLYGGASGYTTNTTGVNVSTGATLKVTGVNGGGGITGLSLLSGGSGYVVINNLGLPFASGFSTTIINPTFGTFVGGPGSATVTFTATAGVVQATPTIVNPGSGYVVGQVLNILQNASATTAIITVASTNGINGGIASLTLTYGGVNYQTTTTAVPLSVSTPIWSTTPSRNGHSINFPSYQSIGWSGITIGQSDSQFPSASSGFTFSLFFNTTDTSDLLQFFFVGPQGGQNVPGCMAFQFDPVANNYNGKFSLAGVYATTGQWDFNANTNLYNMTTANICNGQWHHLVVTCDPTTNTTTLYLDTQVLGTTTGTAFYSLGNGQPMNIGGIGSNQPGNNWYCSDMGIWNRVLTQTEIYQLNFGYSPLMPWDTHFSQHHMQYLNIAIGSFENGFVGISPYDGQTFLYHNGNLHFFWQYSGTQTWLIDSGANTTMTCQTFVLENPIPGATIVLSASNDNVNFTTLQTVTSANSNGLNGASDGFAIGNIYVWQINNTIPYRYYRFVYSVVGTGNMSPFFIWGKRFVTQNAQYKVPPMSISVTCPNPSPFAGQLFNASPFTVNVNQPHYAAAGKIVQFSATPLTVTTTFNHPTVNHDYKFHANPFTVTTQTPSTSIGGNVSFPAGSLEAASSVCVNGTKLYVVTNTTPAYLGVIDISTPTAPSWTRYTLTGANNAKGIAYDPNNGKLYVACAAGNVVEITAATPSTFTVYASGALGDLTTVALLELLNESYFGSNYSTGEVMAFIEAPYATFGMDVHFSQVELETIGVRVNTLNGANFGTNMTWSGVNVPTVGCDVRFLAEDIVDLALTPIARTAFHVYVNGSEITDVKLDSIEIVHTADEKSMARFTVARKHDQVDYMLDGTHQQLTGSQPVTITINGNQEFGYDTPAYIWDIDTKSETESVTITCYSELPKQDVRSTVTLSIPGINEKLHIYHALVNNPVIDNPFIMPDDPNPPFYQGILVDTGYQEIQYGTQLTNNFAFGKQTAEQRANWILGSGDSGIYDFNGDSQYFSPLPNYTYFWFVTATNFLTGEVLQATPGSAGSGDGADFTSSLAYIGTSLSPITSDAWLITDINFWAQRVYPYVKLRGPMPGSSIIYNSDLFGVTLFSDSVLRDHSASTYSGAQIDAMRFALITASNPQNVGFTSGAYNTLNASTKLLDVIDSHFGVHFGSAPYKKVSAKNGWKAPTITWEDQSDGLYVHEDAGFNYISYINQVGAIELKKIQNINGQIAPKTKCDIELFIDGYYHYNIALLMRVNIDNTTTANIYNNNNGFPCSVKSIHISSKDMKVTLGCTNAWSRYELLEMEGQMPDPNQFVTFELRQKICNKLNPATNTTTS